MSRARRRGITSGKVKGLLSCMSSLSSARRNGGSSLLGAMEDDCDRRPELSYGPSPQVPIGPWFSGALVSLPATATPLLFPMGEARLP